MTPYYADDLVTIYHGDARDVVPGVGAVDAIITDPPYGLAARYGAPESMLRRTIAGDGDLSLLLWTAEASRNVNIGWIAVFCGWNANETLMARLAAAGLTSHTVIVWDKGIASSGRGDLRDGPGIREQHEFIVLASRGRAPRPWHGGNVWRFIREQGVPDHPNAKPVTLMRALVARLTDTGATVLDPFMGSGTTLVAAKDMGRRSIGIEIEERYCEIAARRCSQEVLGLLA